MSSVAGEAPVSRRRVFYIPGYDPIHPRRYRELYRKEGKAQADISGYDLTLSPRKGGGRFGWHATGIMDGARTEADIEVLVWSDIVRSSMGHGIPATYLAMLRTAWVYIGSGALWRLMQLRKGPVIAALYPVGMLILQAIIACLAGYGLYRGASLLPLPDLVTRGLGGIAALALIWAILDLFRRWDNRFFVYYLMHDYSYSARTRGANPPALEARIAEFTDAVAEALASDVDEVLVVGHSSGAHLGVSVLADLIRAGRVPQDGPVLSFLTLGQVVPMVSFLPDAQRLRADLRFLSNRDELFWVDVTAPGDGCAFALCDPVAVSGVAPQTQRWPLVFSAAFTQSLSPARWKELRWRFFRLHFQYLCAFDAVKDYDYFRITAGPMTLRQRYHDRPPSPSRKVTPVNKFTSVSS